MAKGVVFLLFVLAVTAVHGQIANPTVTFVINVGGVVEDGTFNEGIYDAALEVTSAAGGTLQTVLSPTFEDQERNLDAAAAAGSDVLLGAGFLMTDAVLASAQRNARALYAMIDGSFPEQPANLVSAVFREDQAGYLAGALAAGVSDSLVVACVGGVPVPAVLKYCNGFRAGFLSACTEPQCTALVVYIPSFTSPDEGAAAAEAFIEAGADVIFAAAGPTGSGATLTAAAQQRYVVGVDVDEYYTTFAQQPLAVRQYLLSSAQKRTDVATQLLLQQFFDGSYSPGSVKVFDVNAQGVDLAPCHDACAAWTPDVSALVQEVQLGLRQNILSTGVDARSGQLLWRGSANDGVWIDLPLWNFRPAARRLHSLSVLDGGLAVVFGGFDSLQQVLGDTYVANLSAPDGLSSWQRVDDSAAAPAPRVDHTADVWTDAAGVQRKVIFGGQAADGALFNDVWSYDAAAGWRQLATDGTGPTPRRAHAMGVAGQRLYVFGGINAAFTTLDDMYVLDLATLRWQQIARSAAAWPSARSGTACSGLSAEQQQQQQQQQQGLVMFGGIQASDQRRVAQLWLFVDATQTWTLLYDGDSEAVQSNGPIGLSNAVLAVNPYDGVFLFGGVGQEAGQISGSLWRFNLFTRDWTLLFNPDGDSPGGLVGSAAAMFADAEAPSAPLGASGRDANEQRPRYRLAVLGGASRQQGLVNALWLYGVEPVPRLSDRYFVCSQRAEFVDNTGSVQTDIAAGVYPASYQCDGYIDCSNLYDEGLQCSPSAEGIFIGFGVVAGLEIVIMLALVVAVARFRDTVVLKVSSVPFLFVVLAAGIWWTSAVFTFFGRPTDAACAIRPWWLAVPFTVMYGALFAKEWRMAVLHESAAKFRRITISNLELGAVIVALLVPDLIILIVWMAVDIPRAVLQQYDGKLHYVCASDWDELFFWLLVGYQLVLLVVGSVQAWRTRSLPSNFGESQYLALSIYDLLFLAAFILPLLYLLQDQPNSLLIIIFIGITVSAAITVALIFVPKLYQLVVKGDRTSNLSEFMSRKSSGPTSASSITHN